MNKHSYSLVAIAALSAFATTAYGQSSVTLYGIIDAGFNYQSNANGGRLFAMTSGVNQGSRFGLVGSEDLGAGLKAIFRLENGFDVTNGRLGQGGLMFGRQAYVGLSNTYGTVTFGRQYDALTEFVGQYSVSNQWGGYISAHPGDLDNFNYSFRSNNAVKFRSADYAGFSFGGTYSLGGIAGDVTRNQIWSVGAGYTRGPLSLGVAYLNARNPNTSLFGGNSATAATATGPMQPRPSTAVSSQRIPIRTSVQARRTHTAPPPSAQRIRISASVAWAIRPPGQTRAGIRAMRRSTTPR